jgi:hypothetical protein
MIPIGRRQSQFRLLLSLLWEEILQIIPLVHISASDVLDLSIANDGLSWFVATFGEGCNIGDINAENVDAEICNFFEPIESWEECAPGNRSVSTCASESG